MFDVSGPDLGGHWVIQLFSTGISWDVYFLFSIEEQLYNIETAQIFK